MKQSIIFAGLATIFFSGMFFQPTGKYTYPAENRTEQTIHIALGSEQRYASPVYANAKADVTVRIIKWKGDKPQVVWQKEINDINLQQHAGVQEFLAKDVELPQVANSRDRVTVNYLITYKDRGSEMQLQYNKEVKPVAGKNSVQVTI